MPHEKHWYERWKRPKIQHGVPTIYGWIVLYPESLSLGKHTDVGCFTLIEAAHGVEIGDKAEIGSHVSIYSTNTIDGTSGKVVIGKRVKIGTHSTVLPGVRIGAGAKIGAYSLVKHDVPAGALAFGIPAKLAKVFYGQ